jgi:glutamate-1-semialdehyde 2,1-aminomutase
MLSTRPVYRCWSAIDPCSRITCRISCRPGQSTYTRNAYDLQDLAAEPVGPTWVGIDEHRAAMRQWMGDRAPQQALLFPMPRRSLDVNTANARLIKMLRHRPEARGLLMITPGCDPTHVQRQLDESRLRGFKVYHCFASRPDTFNAPPVQYIPEWAWEIADRRRLCIMLHLVLPRAG